MGDTLLTSFKNNNSKTYHFEAIIKNELYQRKTILYDIELSNTLHYTTEKIKLLQKNTTTQFKPIF